MNPVPRDTCFVAVFASERPTKSALARILRWCVPDFAKLPRGSFAIVVLMISATHALAQSIKLPNPADPETVVPASKYESAFSDYQPFQEQKSNAWQEVNKEVADNPGMGSMKDMPGKTMSGMDSRTVDAPMSKEAADGHDMGSMKDMPDKAKPGKDAKSPDASMSKDAASGHDMHSMKDMPDKARPGQGSKTADAPMGKEGHDAMRKDKPQTATGQSPDVQTADITGTGVVQAIDRVNGKVKLTHDPIGALGWPKMTMLFRLKDSALADQVKEGQKVEFSLEKTASGYVISGWHGGTAGQDMKKMK